MGEQLNNQSGNYIEPKAVSPTGAGLAVASFVLGILAVVLSPILLGGFCGIVGLILGIMHLTKRYFPRTLALWGLGLSIAGILAATAIFLYGLKVMRQMQHEEAQVFSEWIDKAAPDFTVTDIDGKQFTLWQQKGKQVMVVFWATWCPPCKKEIPNLIKLRNAYDANSLVIIAISNEGDTTLRSFRQTNRLNYIIASAESMPAPYGDVTGIPTVFFADGNGIIRNVTEGYHNFEELKSLLPASDIKGPVTK